jgi:Holliday junction resolvase
LPSEKAITAGIVRALRDRGAWVVKFHGSGYSRRGVPDLLVCHEGRFYGLEVKQPGGHVTPLQRHELKTIEAAGGAAAVVRSVEEALAVVAD